MGFNETRFINILNADLANDLGNLLNRTLHGENTTAISSQLLKSRLSSFIL